MLVQLEGIVWCACFGSGRNKDKEQSWTSVASFEGKQRSECCKKDAAMRGLQNFGHACIGTERRKESISGLSFGFDSWLSTRAASNGTLTSAASYFVTASADFTSFHF